MQYKNWTQLFDDRCATLHTSWRAASQDMGFAAGYVEGIAKGRFKPSRERCLKMAEYFDVDPNEVLALAELYVPPAESPSTIDEIMAEISKLSPLTQRFILQVARALKQAQRRRLAEESPAYQTRTDGNIVSIHIPPGIDPEEVKKVLQQVLEQLYQ